MNSNQKTARIAGLLYLLMAISGPVGLMIVPSKIMVIGNAVATAQNIVANELLFRIGIMSNIICQTSFIFLVLVLNRLFKGVNENYAKLMVSLVITAVPIAFLNELNQIAALHILSGAEYLKAFNPDQLNALAMVFLNLHEQGTFIVGIFWGLWLFPFGYLVIKSGLIPKVLGVLLMIGCFSYLADSSVAILIPKYKATTEILLLPLGIGEISMIFWLLFKGVTDQKPAALEAS